MFSHVSLFELRQPTEKLKARRRVVYLAFMDLGGAYGRVGMEALWQELEV